MHDKTYKKTCDLSKGSDQPGHLLVLLAFHLAHSDDSDQTGQMPGLIWVFARCTCHFAGFVMCWLILHHLGHTMQKRVFGHMQTAKAQISLRIHAVCSGPSLFAYRIINKGPNDILCMHGWSQSGHFVHIRKHVCAIEYNTKYKNVNTPPLLHHGKITS